MVGSGSIRDSTCQNGRSAGSVPTRRPATSPAALRPPRSFGDDLGRIDYRPASPHREMRGAAVSGCRRRRPIKSVKPAGDGEAVISGGHRPPEFSEDDLDCSYGSESFYSPAGMMVFIILISLAVGMRNRKPFSRNDLRDQDNEDNGAFHRLKTRNAFGGKNLRVQDNGITRNRVLRFYRNFRSTDRRATFVLQFDCSTETY